ncbi:hypothetical protein F511_04838 [Dorcoceras hygrometricum]|uniref:Uncharacterized protein n=1 Tax=Dorcoceras hygrometricum TaxID=472368 RepID=A0A2Z7B2M5_9LAMI|nr:hypothetical protein F511_04838 [Dorcoceras hygrometricum]
MCPLRIILIFLSATLAGFLVLRGLKSSPNLSDDVVASAAEEEIASKNTVPPSSGFYAVVGKGFWTCVDMASGRYLWRNLVSSSEGKLHAE